MRLRLGVEAANPELEPHSIEVIVEDHHTVRQFASAVGVFLNLGEGPQLQRNHRGRLQRLRDEQTLGDSGLLSGDLLVVTRKGSPESSLSPTAAGSTSSEPRLVVVDGVDFVTDALDN